MSYFYLFLTIILTVYGQIAIKWQVINAGPFPAGVSEKFLFLFHLLLNPWVISALMAVFLASVSWMAAMTRLQLSYAYPFMSFTFILVMVLSRAIFHEPITPPKIIGMGLIVAGIVVGSQG
ncbi:MAG: EamA family transporter [Dissulfurimicrobium sp.]|uniref:EamA family transporter n=1 Tax=Dissulfurimicrobium sp. TaxID=2022436 RepID=UPI00404B988D